MTDETLYYIVREGTNIRATTRDKTPTIVEGWDRAEEIGQGYDSVVRPRVGRMVPIPVEEYHQRYEEPRKNAKTKEATIPPSDATEDGA